MHGGLASRCTRRTCYQTASIFDSEVYLSAVSETIVRAVIAILRRGEGTHVVMLEKNRMQLFQEVRFFLERHVRFGPIADILTSVGWAKHRTMGQLDIRLGLSGKSNF